MVRQAGLCQVERRRERLLQTGHFPSASGALCWLRLAALVPFAEHVMIGSIARVVVYGLLGLVGLPIATTLLVLALSHALDPRCGTPGDSGGCEMGAVSIGVMAALPGLAFGVALALLQEWRKRQRGQG